MTTSPRPPTDIGFLETLEAVIAERKSSGEASASYTTKLLAAGASRIAQKVGEEGVELALAGASGERDRIVSEAADLLYHVLVLLASRDIALREVVGELSRRHLPPHD